MPHSHDDGSVSQPEVLTLHWEGPAGAEPPPEHRFPGSPEETRAVRAAQMENELCEIARTRQGRCGWISSKAALRIVVSSAVAAVR